MVHVLANVKFGGNFDSYCTAIVIASRYGTPKVSFNGKM